MFDDNTYTRGHDDTGYRAWRRLLNDGTDVYAANMNQYVRKTDTVTFGGLTVNGSSYTTGTATVASLQISGTSSAGTGCATTGLTSKTASGQLLTCQGGVFKLDGDYCGAGYVMSNGGCINLASSVKTTLSNDPMCAVGYVLSGGNCIVIPNQGTYRSPSWTLYHIGETKSIGSNSNNITGTISILSDASVRITTSSCGSGTAPAPLGINPISVGFSCPWGGDTLTVWAMPYFSNYETLNGLAPSSWTGSSAYYYGAMAN